MNLLLGSLASWERVFVCPPKLRWRGLLQTEERRGCDYGFCVCAVGMAKVWAGGEATGIQGGETESWMHALENMTSSKSEILWFGVSA